jgi:hypothetical protein
MAQGQLTKIFDSGSVSQVNNNLHIQDVILPEYGCNGMVYPMRFELVKDDPIFTKISGNLAVFQDIICLPRRHHTLGRQRRIAGSGLVKTRGLFVCHVSFSFPFNNYVGFG